MEVTGKENFEGKWCSGDEALKIQVSPNPFMEMMHITVQSLKSAYRFMLFNSLGTMVSQKDFEESFNIETHTLPPGIYYWTVAQESRLVGRGRCIKAR